MREEVLYVVLLNLTKAYNALDREQCMNIIIMYRVWLFTEHLIHQYWKGLTMVARAVSYYSAPFKGSRGVTQGYLLSPTIFNMVVDTVICY